MPTKKSALLVFPHQLFEVILKNPEKPLVILVEDDLFFRQYNFHKQKLVLHRASMCAFKDRLEQAGVSVDYIQTSKTSSMTMLESALKKHGINHITYYDVVDDWLEQQLSGLVHKLHLQFETIASPAFLTNRGAIHDYFAEKPNRMQSFYEWQRKRLDVLVENNKPTGGKWSFDEKNRKRLPKNIKLPPPYKLTVNRFVRDALDWVQVEFPNNVGNAQNFHYPVTHEQAHKVLEQFLKERFALFGPYEDAIASDQSELFHSVLSPLLNTGLLTPRQVVTRTLQYAQDNHIPIESLEGFIRQIIGWREYMRATYLLYGRKMRTENALKHTRKLNAWWWGGTVGIKPLDQTISRVLDTAYAHHIERLMVCGNAMLLFRIDPNQVYEWFMSLFIDAYDWVMVPNVYAMSQFAVSTMVTTKPYISSSNYILKMSDYTKDDWCEIWDALYWRFIADNRHVFEANPRAGMMVKLLDKQSSNKKRSITELSNEWLA